MAMGVSVIKVRLMFYGAWDSTKDEPLLTQEVEMPVAPKFGELVHYPARHWATWKGAPTSVETTPPPWGWAENWTVGSVYWEATGLYPVDASPKLRLVATLHAEEEP